TPGVCSPQQHNCKTCRGQASSIHSLLSWNDCNVIFHASDSIQTLNERKTMTKKYASLFLIGLLGAIPAAILGQDARTVLANTSKAMGADIRTLQFSGMGSR